MMGSVVVLDLVMFVAFSKTAKVEKALSACVCLSHKMIEVDGEQRSTCHRAQ